MARILYFSHDNPNPSGGVRTLYRHVETLRRAGFDAYVVHLQNGFRLRWFDSSAPILYAQERLELAPEDWAVVPEDLGAALEQLRAIACHKAVFCQSHYQVFHCIPPEASWRDYGVEAVLASSLAIHEFVHTVFAMDAVHVPLSLDLDLFRPGERRRPLRVAFMPRRGPQHLRLARGIVHHRAPDLRDMEWTAIHGYREPEVAALLQHSAFFLSTGSGEGFGLPPLEAMACGAMVVGFRAGGGAEYARDDNGFWVSDEDGLALAEEMIRVLRLYRRGGSEAHWEAVRAAGYATAARYGRETEAQRLLEFWSARAPDARR